ncbi:MAG: sensor histidine kinase, partial [Paracoccaceae bacterium]
QRLLHGTQIRSVAQPHERSIWGMQGRLPELLAACIAGALGMAFSAIFFAGVQSSRANRAEAKSASMTRDLQAANASLSQQIDVQRKAEAAALHAQAASERFLATVSHEVRTPLNAIMGMFELIARANVTPRVTRQAQAGRAAALRLFAELTNVLDASRLDAGAISVSKSTTNLPDLIRRWEDTLTALVDSSHKPVTARMETAPTLPDHVWIDPERVTKIINNLLDNAVKFTAQGSVTLHISTRKADLVVRVKDTGLGIPKDRHDSLFQRFYQIEDARTRSLDGAGLGLAICAEIADLMGSKLDIEPSGGTQAAGSVFRLTLTNALVLPPTARAPKRSGQTL